MTCPVLTVLIVKSFPADRDLYRYCLQADSSGAYRFLEADSAIAGLELCQMQQIDAIILNYMLPDASGLEFLEALQAQSNGHPPVVIVSNEGDEKIPSQVVLQNAVRAIKLGAEDYLTSRDLTPQILLSTVQSAIENGRKKLQLRQNDELFRVSVENMLDCFGIYSAIRDKFGQIVDFRFDYLNAAALEGNQMTRADIGKSLCEVFPAHRETGLFAEYCRVVETGEPLTKEDMMYSDVFGTQQFTRAYDLRASKLGDGFVASWRDVTARKIAQVEIEEAKETLGQQLAQIQAIYATAPIGLCFLDRERRFVQLNERLAEINGLSVTEHLGRTIREILPELAEIQEPIFEQVTQTGVPVLDVEVQGTTPAYPDIERYWLVSYYPLTAPNGRCKGINIMVQEITERKQAERKLQELLDEAQAARAEAETANRSKDEFVAVVAHELRSPLNSVLGWAKLLRSRNYDATTRDKALLTIERNTQAQVQLVEDLLDISRMVRGTLHIDLAPVNLVEVIEAALDSVRPMATAKQIQLKTKTQLTSTLHTYGDFNRLQQIFINLLTNAIKFTPNQGRVDIELQVESQVQIRISDTGKGIAPEFLPSIFERFQQGQRNTGSKDGLGLGLAIVKHLVELHSGTITVESQGVGQGATFTVQLPLLESIKESPPVACDGACLAGIRILVVDDELDMLDLVTFVLEETGAEVQSATSGFSALERLPLFKPDIVVSDIAMPDGNGYELVQKMKFYPEGQIPAIALTAYASATYQERSLQAGFAYHLTKPVESVDLVAAIVSLVKGKKK